MWTALEPLGRDGGSGGYRRYAWTRTDHDLREWFTGEAAARGLDVTEDRMGNQWAWWGDPATPWAGGSRASSPAPTSTACPTAVRSTDRSGS